ncbi:MAG: Stp1/IreP family PP2C-type Ser/Thr phosphatase [Halorhabdus sp.]
MSYQTVARTDVGRVRDVNEDAVYASATDEWGLLVVADGMGGHTAGDVASEAAIEAFRDVVEPELADGYPGESEALFRNAAIEANDELRQMIDEDRSLEGMGTTLVAALLAADEATLVNVGDSRGYHVTEGAIQQVTVDHSLVQQLVDEGEITPEEARDHPQRNVVSQALGTQDSVDPDTVTVALDGWIMLCSDGLTEEVPDHAIQTIVADAADPSAAAEALVARANENGGSDNVSVAIGHRSS